MKFPLNSSTAGERKNSHLIKDCRVRKAAVQQRVEVLQDLKVDFHLISNPATNQSRLNTLTLAKSKVKTVIKQKNETNHPQTQA